MTTSDLQRWIDRLAQISPQRWLLMALSLVCVAGASSITAWADGSRPGVVLVLLLALAAVAVVRPDSHAGLVVVIAMVWQWLASIDEVTTPWAIPFGALLFVFHCTIALMAVTPIGAHVDGVLLARWSRRILAVGAATVGMWFIVLVTDQRRAPGSTALSVAGFLIFAVLIAVMRQRSTPPPPRPTGTQTLADRS
jgi:hypothetical protein